MRPWDEEGANHAAPVGAFTQRTAATRAARAARIVLATSRPRAIRSSAFLKSIV